MLQDAIYELAETMFTMSGLNGGERRRECVLLQRAAGERLGLGIAVESDDVDQR